VSDIDRDELAARIGEDALVLLDVRSAEEYSGAAGYPCDARQGHIPGARHADLQELMALDADGVRALVPAPPGAEVIVYCHSGGRSAMAAQLLRTAGYEARNYVGSWHEWAADGTLPVIPSPQE
jgi:thiosulfate/3-mercaptopyruvate sulfurtransferase